MSIGLITELEIINSVLNVTGDNPVQSLDEEYQPVFIIRQMLRNISRDIQSKGYWFNTEYGVTLEPNSITQNITLPFNLLRFEPEDTKYVARGERIFNREDRTDIITESVVADLVVQLEFDNLPQAARKLLQAKCREQYNNEYYGDTTNKQALEREKMMAQADLDKLHLENEDINMLDNHRAYNIAFRNRRRY